MRSISLGLALLVAGVLVLARTSDGAPPESPGQTALAQVGNASAGKETFTQYCSICHGVGARGFIGPSIAGINWTAPGLHAIVRGGLGGYGSMPAFNADVVTDSNIANIAAYLASLPPAPAAKSSPTAQTIAVTPAASATSKIAVTAATPASQAAPSSSAAGNLEHGRQVFTTNCAACHGASAQGGIGPSLLAERTRKDTAAAVAWIKNPLPPMPKLYPAVLSAKDVDDVAAFIESL